MNDFYVGYLPKAPTALARFVRRVIIMLGLLAVTTSLVLVVGQMPFANSAFEYGKVRSFEGVVVTQPFPTLLVARPGAVGQQTNTRAIYWSRPENMGPTPSWPASTANRSVCRAS